MKLWILSLAFAAAAWAGADHGAPISASLHVWTTYTEEGTYDPWEDMRVGQSTISLDVWADGWSGPWIWQHGVHGLQDHVFPITSPEVPNLHLLFSIEGSVYGDSTTTVTVNDAYIEWVCADHSLSRSRPAAGHAFDLGTVSSASVALPGGSITRWHYSGLSTSDNLVLYNFLPAAYTAGVPGVCVEPPVHFLGSMDSAMDTVY